LCFVVVESYPKRAKREDSPKLDLQVDAQYNKLIDIFPDADPNYLRYNANRLNKEEEFYAFIEKCLEKGCYPSKEECFR